MEYEDSGYEDSGYEEAPAEESYDDPNPDWGEGFQAGVDAMLAVEEEPEYDEGEYEEEERDPLVDQLVLLSRTFRGR
jgi:hypothetical protein